MPANASGYPTRLTYGIATVPAEDPLGDYPHPDPFHTSSNDGKHVTSYDNDFYTLATNAAGWTTTGASSTFAIVDGLGGLARLTPGAATTASSTYMTNKSFRFTAQNRFWFLMRIAPSAVAGTLSYQFGLQAGASTADAVYFQKAANSTSLNFVSVVGGVTTMLATGIDTAAAGKYHDVAFYYDGKDVLVYANDVAVARITAPTIGASGTTLTNALLSPVFQITPTATDTMTIDYLLSAQEVVR